MSLVAVARVDMELLPSLAMSMYSISKVAARWGNRYSGLTLIGFLRCAGAHTLNCLRSRVGCVPDTGVS